MRTIAIANQKGGCGKTTTAINLSAALSLKGRRVLLIDLDPQAHATMGLDKKPRGPGRSIYHVVRPHLEEDVGLDDIVIPIRENFDLAPSSVVLCAFEQEMVGIEGREHRLLDAIERLRTPYDYVVIDCPPSIGLLCVNALCASKEVVIPIDMSLFSLRGVIKLVEIILMIRERTGHEIHPRALITMYDYRTRYAKQVLEKVKERFGNNVFDSVIRYNVRLRETVDHGLPIGDYDKHSIGSKDYEQLAEEVIAAEDLGMADRTDSMLTARDILANAGRYIQSAGEAVEDVVDEEGMQPAPLRSSYPEMMEACAAGGPASNETDPESLEVE